MTDLIGLAWCSVIPPLIWINPLLRRGLRQLIQRVLDHPHRCSHSHYIELKIDTHPTHLRRALISGQRVYALTSVQRPLSVLAKSIPCDPTSCVIQSPLSWSAAIPQWWKLGPAVVPGFDVTLHAWDLLETFEAPRRLFHRIRTPIGWMDCRMPEFEEILVVVAVSTDISWV